MLQKLHNLSESAQGLHVVLIFEPLQITHQAPVVRKVDNAIRRINHYPVDSVIQTLNNRGQICTKSREEIRRSRVSREFANGRPWERGCLETWSAASPT